MSIQNNKNTTNNTKEEKTMGRQELFDFLKEQGAVLGASISVYDNETRQTYCVDEGGDFSFGDRIIWAPALANMEIYSVLPHFDRVLLEIKIDEEHLDEDFIYNYKELPDGLYLTMEEVEERMKTDPEDGCDEDAYLECLNYVMYKFYKGVWGCFDVDSEDEEVMQYKKPMIIFYGKSFWDLFLETFNRLRMIWELPIIRKDKDNIMENWQDVKDGIEKIRLEKMEPSGEFRDYLDSKNVYSIYIEDNINKIREIMKTNEIENESLKTILEYTIHYVIKDFWTSKDDDINYLINECEPLLEDISNQIDSLADNSGNSDGMPAEPDTLDEHPYPEEPELEL